MLKQIRLSHELSAAWIIALWKAIYGGDPTPEQIAAEAIAALATQLHPRVAVPAREEGFDVLKSRLATLGLHFVEHEVAETAARPAGEAELTLPPRHTTTRYCFRAPQGEVCAEIIHQVFEQVG